MAKVDLEAALKAVEPETKAAQTRKVMPIIEAQLKAGVRRQAILDVLKAQGIEISMETFKSYLYRYRKSLKEGKQPNAPRPADEQKATRVETEPASVSYDIEPDTETTNAAPGPSELSKIMNPGDDANASEMARYENAGKRPRRNT
ncbi:hypothetical protein RGV33_32885 [Pseudomonas sp. Bout1]|uniref:hypothetical protein n=1 Tax=Pseudomonas sp. Bout1 TaxID=3048600 RepID=UPI002AB49452|nr:hypothetical protein [Pseudomonas sp. Bout1]MDY7536419.1 hypothetical protein [Pseudomonas sp. Bout1]MEB0187518.1 hypothetical protein [Pseudomonas sp. Bout1]